MVVIHKVEQIFIAAISRTGRQSDSDLQANIGRNGLKKLPVLTVTEQGLVCVSGNRRIDAVEALGWVTIDAYVILGNVNEVPEQLLY